MSGLSQRIARLGFELKERYQGRSTFKVLDQAMAHERLSPDEIAARTWRKAQAVVRFAADRVPYYQRTWQGIDLDAALASPEAFAQLPVTEREDLRAAGRDFVAPDMRGQLIHSATSGSSGEVLRFWQAQARHGWSTVARIRAWRWWNLDYGDRTVMLFGRPTFSKPGTKAWWYNQQARISNELAGIRRLSAMGLSQDEMRAHVETLRRLQPVQLCGYGQSLWRLAEFMQREGLALENNRLRAVIYWAEAVPDEARDVMREAFGAPVCTEYVCREFGHIAHECPHGNLHIADDNLLVEVLDEKNRPVVDEPGDVVITDLNISRTPFVRYRMTDRATLAPTDYRCPCGRPMRVISAIHGRTVEEIALRDGGTVPPYAFNRPLSVIAGATHCQARVTGDSITYQIECSPEALAPHRERIAAWIREIVHGEYTVTVEAVPHIAPTAGGKYMMIVHHPDEGADD